MDSASFGVISTLLMAFAIVAVSWWAFSPKRRKRFKEDAQLPFAEDENDPDHQPRQNKE